MSDMAASHAAYRFTVDQYRLLGDTGVLAPDLRVELIEGEIVESVAPMKPPHAHAVGSALELIATALGARAFVRCQLPITLGAFSEPEPDLAIVFAPRGRYSQRHPHPPDIFALLEVSDTSRFFDVTRKVPLYAKHRIPEVWIVDLVDGCIRSFRDPKGSEYREQVVTPRGGSIAFSAFQETSFNVDDFT